jgi:hypothetical protein
LWKNRKEHLEEGVSTKIWELQERLMGAKQKEEWYPEPG